MRMFYGIDKHMRFEKAAESINLEGTILDVGGGEGDFFDFLETSGIIAEVPTDRSLFPEIRYAHPYVMYDGTSLPFKDDSFDTVVALDTLEHVPPENRESLLIEIQRVAREAIILTFPERHFLLPLLLAIGSFLQRSGISSIMKKSLEEHLRYGLPMKADILPIIDESVWNVYDQSFFGPWSGLFWVAQFFLPFLATAPFNRGVAGLLNRARERRTGECLLILKSGRQAAEPKEKSRIVSEAEKSHYS